MDVVLYPLIGFMQRPVPIDLFQLSNEVLRLNGVLALKADFE